MFKNTFLPTHSKSIAFFIIALLCLSACSARTPETPANQASSQTKVLSDTQTESQAEAQTETSSADEPSTSTVKNIPEDVSLEMVSYYPYFKDKARNIDSDPTAVTKITWSGSTSAAELGVATSLPIWAYMTLAEESPVNPFILLRKVSNAPRLQEDYALRMSSYDKDNSSTALDSRLYEWTASNVQSMNKDIISLSADAVKTEYSINNCEKLLEIAGFSVPVYEADDCLYSYFGSAVMGHFLTCDLAAVYFFPDDDKKEIDHAEIQFLYNQTPVGMDLYGGWAGSSTSSSISHDTSLLKLFSLIHVLELTLAGETDIMNHVGSDTEGVQENYTLGSGDSDLQAKLHQEGMPLGSVYTYSLTHE